MKIVCNRSALLDMVASAVLLTNSRTPKPVLRCVKLTAAGGANPSLTLAATDLDRQLLLVSEQVEVESPGEMLLDADTLRNILRESPGDTLSIALAGEQAVLTTGDAVFKLYTMPVGDYPPVADDQGDADFTLPASTFRAMVNQTIFATSQDGSRYAMSGVLLETVAKTLNVVATDGRRLVFATRELPGDQAGDHKGLIPIGLLKLAEKVFDDPEETISVRIEKSRVVLKTTRALIASTLVEGAFPPYADVIPKSSDKKMTVATADLLGAIRRGSLMSGGEIKGVSLAFSKAGLLITARTPESGDSRINLPCKYEGADLTVGFNATYIAEALRAVDCDEITFELTEANRPGLLRGGSNWLCVLMPITLAQ